MPTTSPTLYPSLGLILPQGNVRSYSSLSLFIFSLVALISNFPSPIGCPFGVVAHGADAMSLPLFKTDDSNRLADGRSDLTVLDLKVLGNHIGAAAVGIDSAIVLVDPQNYPCQGNLTVRDGCQGKASRFATGTGKHGIDVP